jgi:hypothetical protein
MTLSPIYLQKLEEVRQEGRQQNQRTVIENLMLARFGSIDDELSAIVEPLLALAPEQFTSVLIQLSREELSREDLLNRFR